MKRTSEGHNGDDSRNKKSRKGRYFSKDQNIEPGTSGIYVTCIRKKEFACSNEMAELFSEFSKKIYGTDSVEIEDGEDDDDDEPGKAGDSDDIASMIAKEVDDLKSTEKKAQKLFTLIDVNCECLLFFKTRKPVVPVDFVYEICRTAAKTKQKNTRYCLRLTPVTKTCSASIENLKTLAKEVLKPHFHQETDQKPLSFAIQVTARNHNVLKRGDIITSIAECVGHDHGHKVDLKKYDKLIIVECFKSSVGMAVVDRDYEELQRFNLDRLTSSISEKNSKSTQEKEDKVAKQETAISQDN